MYDVYQWTLVKYTYRQMLLLKFAPVLLSIKKKKEKNNKTPSEESAARESYLRGKFISYLSSARESNCDWRSSQVRSKFRTEWDLRTYPPPESSNIR